MWGDSPYGRGCGILRSPVTRAAVHHSVKNSFSLHSPSHWLPGTLLHCSLYIGYTVQLCVGELQLSTGMLSGLSRRVSSLFFRAGAAVTQDTRRLLVAEHGRLFLLTDTHLQRWQRNQDHEEPEEVGCPVLMYTCIIII